ncbi:MAG: response regulator [Chromatiales bacterium]|nr:response regulator [Chromatiales bacterium]
MLVVDDNATNREILEHQLQGWSMRYTGAEGGAAALRELEHAAARGEPFDLAILDLHMPGMDGFELAQAIKADAHRAAMPLVMLLLGERGLGSSAAARRTHRLLSDQAGAPVRSARCHLDRHVVPEGRRAGGAAAHAGAAGAARQPGRAGAGGRGQPGEPAGGRGHARIPGGGRTAWPATGWWPWSGCSTSTSIWS